MKTCIACDRELPVDEFYRNRRYPDGRLGKCRACCRSYAMQFRRRRLMEMRAYDKERNKAPRRRAQVAAGVKAYYRAHPGRERTNVALNNAVKKGRIIKPKTCSQCGSDGNGRIEGHHEDYSRPLDVVWVCKPCHVGLDRLRRAASAGTL